jgi:peptidoglycan/LPS O-acetylase OafA/YrhL
MVFVYHTGQPSPLLYQHADAWIRLPFATMRALVIWGRVGVDLFFTLSAFLITTFLLEERRRFGNVSFRWFFRRRALRIWPLYFLAVTAFCVVLPMLGIFVPNLKDSELPGWVASYCLFLGNMWNALQDRWVEFAGAPLWSVCVEEHFYVIWGILLSRVSSTVVLAGALCLAELNGCVLRWAMLGHGLTSQALYYNTFTHLDPIVAGAGLALASKQLPRLGAAAGTILLIAAATAVGIVVLIPGVSLNDPRILAAPPLVAFCCAAFLLGALSWSPLRTLLSRPGMVSFGKLTYGLYVFHYLGLHMAHGPVQRWLVSMHLPGLELESSILVLKLSIGLALTYGMAKLSWAYIEAPCLRQKKQFTRVASGEGIS